MKYILCMLPVSVALLLSLDTLSHTMILPPAIVASSAHHPPSCHTHTHTLTLTHRSQLEQLQQQLELERVEHEASMVQVSRQRHI